MTKGSAKPNIFICSNGVAVYGWRGYYPLPDNSEKMVQVLFQLHAYYTPPYLPLKGSYRLVMYFTLLPFISPWKGFIGLYTVFSSVAEVTEVAKLPKTVSLPAATCHIKYWPLQMTSDYNILKCKTRFFASFFNTWPIGQCTNKQYIRPVDELSGISDISMGWAHYIWTDEIECRTMRRSVVNQRKFVDFSLLN